MMLKIHQRLLDMMEPMNQPSTFITVQCMLQMHSKSIPKYFFSGVLAPLLMMTR